MGNCASSAGSVAIAREYRGTSKHLELGPVQAPVVQSDKVKPAVVFTDADWIAIGIEMKEDLQTFLNEIKKK